MDEKQVKDKKQLVCNLTIWLVAILVAGCFVLTFFSSVRSHATKDYDIVLLGDSIIGKERLFTTVDACIAEKTGKSVFNGAFGGSCASTANYDMRYDYHEDSLNLCRFVDGICQQDLGVQLSDLPNNQFQSWYFPESLQEMDMIDFGKTDVFILQHGTNDYSGGRPLDNPENPKDIYTYGGALRYSIERLQETYPDAEIVLVTPAFCWIAGYGTSDEQDFGYGTMEAYAEKKIEIAKEYDLPIIDAYHDLDFHKDNIIGYTEDGMHLNEEGRKIYGDFLGSELQKILKETNGE